MVRIHVGQPILTQERLLMNFEEKQILDFLKPMAGVFFTVAEIGRKAGSRKQYHDNPTWPRPYLVSLADQGLLDSNPLGHFSYKEAHEKKKRRYKVGSHMTQMPAEGTAKPVGATSAEWNTTGSDPSAKAA